MPITRRFRPLLAALALLLLFAPLPLAAPPAAVAQDFCPASSPGCPGSGSGSSPTFAPRESSPSAPSDSSDRRRLPEPVKDAAGQEASATAQEISRVEAFAIASTAGGLAGLGALGFSTLGVGAAVLAGLGISGLNVSLVFALRQYHLALQDYLNQLNRIVSDPPDPNFTVFAQPVVRPLTPVLPDATLSPAAADAFNALILNQAQMAAVAQAFITSFERSQGAAAAGNAQFQALQLRAAGVYALQLAQLQEAQPALRVNLLGALFASGAVPPQIISTATPVLPFPLSLTQVSRLDSMLRSARIFRLFAAQQQVFFAPPVSGPPAPPPPIVLPPPPAPVLVPAP